MKRRFVHVDGFKDGTKYILVTDSHSYIVRSNGTRRRCFPGNFDLEVCLRFVAEGTWKELK